VGLEQWAELGILVAAGACAVRGMRMIARGTNAMRRAEPSVEPCAVVALPATDTTASTGRERVERVSGFVRARFTPVVAEHAVDRGDEVEVDVYDLTPPFGIPKVDPATSA
jgi:hypothetical protein